MLHFCCTMKWVYVYIYLLPLEPPSHTHTQSCPSGSSQSPRWAPRGMQQAPISYLLYAWSCVCVKPNLPICPTLPFPHCVHMFVLYICLYPVLQIGSSVSVFFYIPHRCVNILIQYLFFSHLFHSVWQTLGSSTYLQMTQFHSFSWLSNIQKEMATQFGILAWKIPWTEQPGGLQSTGSQRVRHD